MSIHKLIVFCVMMAMYTITNNMINNIYTKMMNYDYLLYFSSLLAKKHSI